MQFPDKLKPTRDELKNIFAHHPPQGDQAARYQQVRTVIMQATIECIELTPASSEQVRAVAKMQEAMMLFNASIAINEKEKT